MAVQRLGHVAIRVADIQRAKAFYLGLGMRMVWDADDWAYLEAGQGRDGLALLGPDYRAAGPHFAFHFKDRTAMEQLHGRLRAEGAAMVGAIHDHRDGTASFYLKDPEGNWLEMLYEPPQGVHSNLDGLNPVPSAPGPGH
ncbi:MAG: VOC family protein [Aphanocapsa feldmannii 277cV]|uniref:VOC family protein n=2 Tax=Aphanocapsa feldmannii TaxID=192050 RepID=A0A524RSA8_9CHRO|nr:MAG: VOC family protein [Aphanocapsa feldmannii 288cV]TGG96839.1 MAG: VOC family protein [Aphanocapsa feldmannii 277cV]TGH26427.1 MAG: VOC family protein [Aphanocapsa feldmannii 277cI]